MMVWELVVVFFWLIHIKHFKRPGRKKVEAGDCYAVINTLVKNWYGLLVDVKVVKSWSDFVIDEVHLTGVSNEIPLGCERGK